ncbi:MAG: carbohydrate binding family 9 domain-containing protein [Reichenbachiella sp.]
MSRFFVLLISISFFRAITPLLAQKKEPIKTYETTGIRGTPPVIDGLMNEDSWDLVEWGGDFVGHMPEYKATPSQETQFKILYDAKFLYVGIRAFDTEPDKIVKRMSRRDGFEGDWVEINIDSYNDKRTAFSFTASASGVKGDEYVTNNGNNWDSTWDPIWYLKTSIDDKGWIAEFKIPLSQLRFADKPELTWGIQLTRRFFRNEERSTWQPVSPQAPGWVHLFGELKGIKGIKPQKQLEVQPFIVGQLESFPVVEGDPYRDTGKDWDGNIGVDAKIGITSDITLDLTVNPDFGQVEADPSVVNLTAFEQFFRERRPFFLEGNNIFDFPTSGGRNNLFYSRRIGAPAHGGVSTSDTTFVDRIPNTRILSAAKITGKNAHGFSWGVQTALTGKTEVAVSEIDTLQNERYERMEKVEPFSIYTAARVQQDFNEGQTVVGGIFTHMNRIGNDVNDLNYLHDNAQSAGLDITHLILNRRYGFRAQLSGSRIEGSEDAILNTQTSYVRNFQRPDNDYRSIDSTLTSMLGTSSRFQFGKKSGKWVWELGVNHKSPELELNDIGFLSNTDNINVWGWTQYRILTPTKIFRQQRYNLHHERNYDFGGSHNYSGTGPEVYLEFQNFWSFHTNLWYESLEISNADLRGGPSFRNPGSVSWNFRIRTNTQKKVSGYIRPYWRFGEDNALSQRTFRFGMVIRPLDALLISLDPSFSENRNDVQYVETLDINGNPLYLLGRINQQTFSMGMRANYSITPNISVEFWGQPFMSVGEYSEFKEVTDSRNEDYNSRFNAMGNGVRIPTEAEIAEYESRTGNSFPDMGYGVFKTNNNIMDTHLGDPDFNIVNFRSNLVFRWEYKPGSTLFAVWSSNSSQFDQNSDNDFEGMADRLWNLEATNTFLIKYTYRFIL